MDDWNIPKIPQDTLYVPETIKDKHNFDYIIKIVENNIPLGQDVGEEFHLLSKNSIYEHITRIPTTVAGARGCEKSRVSSQHKDRLPRFGPRGCVKP